MEDERFATRTELLKGDNALILYNALVERFKSKTAAEWSEIFTRIDAAHQIVNRSGDVSRDPQAFINNYVARMTCPDGRSFVVPNSPITFFGVERPQSAPVGPIGCDTEEVLREYGYTGEQIEEMLDSGAAYVKNRPQKN
jgi:crotonobetainyl-CoA:carnitine CoA-transferase CaiB-like acyl-CoA transferase